ncbi:unnamed protein product [Mytilus edulis]|uniref:G-protein coupled receptors family 1 profile domain-containing protein n=1 Tax=Mytilus edulis TaxID=6550 RepID=A0A8S3TPJ0_MYTED|nr:unnamed protein product [Mytilus edulis]
MYNYLNSTLGNVLLKVILLMVVFVTNSFVAIVWLSPSNRTPVSILLSIIALYDTLTITFGSAIDVASYIGGRSLSVDACYVVMASATLAFIFHSLSIISTTYLAIQRCVICAFPFSGPRLCGLRTNIIFAIVSLVSMIALKMPDLLISDIEGVINILDDNTSVLYCNVNYMLNDEAISVLPKIYMYIRFFALHLIPACIISFCMVFCLLIVNRKKMTTSESSEQQRTKTRTTLMLTLIMFIFIVGEFPTTISVFYRAFFTKEPMWLTTSTGNRFCNITLVISYMINIWVYIAMSKQFRDGLLSLFCNRVMSSNKSKAMNESKLANISSVPCSNSSNCHKICDDVKET